MTTRQALTFLAALGLTFGGIAAFNHYSSQAAGRECVAQGFSADQCWEGR